MNQDIEPRTHLDTASVQSHKNLALIGYALQALGLITGIAAVAGVILNYIKRSEVQGSYIASHFTWQIKTFWYALAGAVISWLLMFVLIGFPLMIAVVVWVIYRIVKGWLALAENQPVDATKLV